MPGADEEASRRWQTVRPLHLPEVHLPAYDQARPETTQPRALAGGGKSSVCLDTPHLLHINLVIIKLLYLVTFIYIILSMIH